MNYFKNINLNISLAVIALLIILALPENAFSQTCGLSNGSFVAGVAATCSQSTINPANTGNYYGINVTSGISYNFSTSSSSFASRIIVKQTNNSGTLIANQNNNNITTDDESFDWVATFSGVAAIAVHQDNCGFDPSPTGTSGILRYRQNTTLTLTNSAPNTDPICPSGTKTIAYSIGGGGSGTISWAVTAGGGTINSSGVYSPGAYTGLVSIQGTIGVCTSNIISFTVKTNPATPTASADVAICDGASTNLTATGALGTGGSYEWYTDGCGTTPIGSGTSITVSPLATRIYYLRTEADCNTTACDPVTVTVTN